MNLTKTELCIIYTALQVLSEKLKSEETHFRRAGGSEEDVRDAKLYVGHAVNLTCRFEQVLFGEAH